MSRMGSAPRRADLRRSWLCVRLSVANHAFRSERAVCTRSGWRKPAVANERECTTNERDRTSDTDNHGGLTPAALGRMYVCASQKSLFRRQTFALQGKSGGVSPRCLNARDSNPEPYGP